MAVAPIIRSNGSVSGIVTGAGRNDLDIGETVTLTDAEAGNSGASYLWTLVDKPIGSSASITNPSSATATFVPDVTGSYWIKCTVNGSLTLVSEKILGVPLPNSEARIPAFRERLVFDGDGNTKGWHTTLTTFMRWVDANAGGGGGGGPSPFTGTPSPIGTAGPGASALYSRGDHTHALPAVGPGAGTISTTGQRLSSITLDAEGRVTAVATAFTYDRIESNGVTVSSATRRALNFTTRFVVTDNAGGGRTDVDFRQVAAVSVLGNGGASPGVVADITSAVGNGVLKSNGPNNALSWGLLTTDNIASNASIQLSQLQNLSAQSVAGNPTSGPATMTAIGASSAGHLLRYTGSAIDFGVLQAGSVSGTQTNGFVVTLVAGAPAWAAAAGGGGGYATVENNGTPVTQRTTLNLSTEFTATDASSKTAIALTTGGVPLSKLATGTANNLAFFNGSGVLAPSGVTLASNLLTHAVSSSGGAVGALIENTSNTASSAATFELKVAGASAGNPRIRLTLGSVSQWDLYTDNADGDAFKIRDPINGETRMAVRTTATGNGSGATTIFGSNAAGVGFDLEVYSRQSTGWGTIGAIASAGQSQVVAYNTSLNAAAYLSQVGASTAETFFGFNNAGWSLLRAYGASSGLAIGTTVASPVIIGAGNIKRIEIPAAATSPVNIIDATGATVSF